MRYEGTVYRPPSEANSLLIQATVGCPHNRCAFCEMYRDKRFRIRPTAELLEDLQSAREVYGSQVRSLFFPDGNSIVLKTDELARVIQRAYELFPRLERVTTYGSAKFLIRKSFDDLQRLRAAGLTRIHAGMESGDAVTLERINKGADPQTMIEAGRRVKEAGIELSEYVMIGIGGVERTREHAIASGQVLSAVDPDFIRIRTFVPRPGTPLYERWQRGEFALVDAYQALDETALLIEHIDGTSELHSDHISNFIDVAGRFPEDKSAMLAVLQQAKTRPRSAFRPPTEELIHLMSL
ncbi:MAG: radical SAM protein [Candidatus Alcyoniella australis]|nr:radical SAM protein [Candidatus Alcyoniella australis]